MSVVYLYPDRAARARHIHATIIVANTVDEARAEAGEIVPADIRSVTLHGVLVSTGTTHLCLPADLVALLGLRPLRALTVNTAAGPYRGRLFKDADLTVLGRTSPVPVLELPQGARPLLGSIPLDMIGLQPDIANRRLALLPEGPGETYVNAMAVTLIEGE